MEKGQLIKIIENSYKRYFNSCLPGVEDSHDLDSAPYPILSHSPEADPIFTFGNKRALEIFEYSLDEFTKLPSRLSAEAALREDRERIMKEVRDSGFTKSYEGIRISKSGKRFEITNAAIWNLQDEKDLFVGQAAAIFKWKAL